MNWPPNSKRFNPEDSLASPSYGQKTMSRLEVSFRDLTSINDEAAKFAFDETKASYELARDRFKALDGKAVSLIGIVTTGLGAIALLGDASKTSPHGLWFFVSVGSLSLALIASLASLAPAGVANPDLSPYVWPKTLSNVDNLARMRVALARDWLRDAASVEHANAEKGGRLRIATILLVAGLAGLVGNNVSNSELESRFAPFGLVTSPKPCASSTAVNMLRKARNVGRSEPPARTARTR